MTADIIVCFQKYKIEIEAANEKSGIIIASDVDSKKFEVLSFIHGRLKRFVFFRQYK